MAISKKSKKFFRRIWGTFLTVVLLPFAAVFSILAHICLGVAWLFSSMWEVAADFWRMMTDPGYYRIGWIDGMYRASIMGKASQAWSKGDKQEAIAYWHRAARLYDNLAMFRLAQCYENGDGLEKDLSKAYECYSLADIYHHEMAEADCQRLEQFAMSRGDRARFLDTIWNRR